MTQVPEHGAVTLTHLLAHVFAERKVRFIDIEGDDTVVVTGHDGLIFAALEKSEFQPALRR